MGRKRQGSGLQLSPGCTLVPNGSDSLDNSVPKVIPKVTSSGVGAAPPSQGCPQQPFYTSGAWTFWWEQGGKRVSRREGRVHGQQQLYGWPGECEAKGTSVLLPSSPMLCPTGSSREEPD